MKNAASKKMWRFQVLQTKIVSFIQTRRLTDGTFLLDGGMLFGTVPRTEWEQWIPPNRKNQVRLGLNPFLIQAGKHNILVDPGMGVKRLDRFRELWSLNGNKLVKSLKSLTPRDISIVVLTNLRFDHAGGCTKFDRNGWTIPSFPKAKYFVQKKAWEVATNPDALTESCFYPDDFLPLEEQGKLELLDGKENEIVPGVTLKPLSGPSEGHQIVLIKTGAEKIVYPGDLIPTHWHVSLPVIPAWHQYPVDTLSSKRITLEMITEQGWLTFFPRGHELHAGYIEMREGKFHIRPAER